MPLISSTFGHKSWNHVTADHALCPCHAFRKPCRPQKLVVGFGLLLPPTSLSQRVLDSNPVVQPPHGTSHPPPTPLLPDPNARCRRGTTSSARRRSSGKQTQFSDKRDKRGCETAMVAGKLRRGKKDGEESKYKGRWWGSLGCLNPPRSRVLPPLC